MEPRKILNVLGSPRKKGNSALLAKEVAAGAQSAGALVETFNLQKMQIAPCVACDGCRKKKATGCVVQDDMQLLYPKILAADALVIASPVYWFAVSAQTKAFIDRWYALNKIPGTLAGKKLGIVLAYADADAFISGAVNALRMFQDISAYLGTEIEGMVYGQAAKAGEIAGNAGVMAEARALGVKLAGAQTDSL
jgi:multimeric flavodoxin WrbA